MVVELIRLIVYCGIGIDQSPLGGITLNGRIAMADFMERHSVKKTNGGSISNLDTVVV